MSLATNRASLEAESIIVTLVNGPVATALGTVRKHTARGTVTRPRTVPQLLRSVAQRLPRRPTYKG